MKNFLKNKKVLTLAICSIAFLLAGEAALAKVVKTYPFKISLDPWKEDITNFDAYILEESIRSWLRQNVHSDQLKQMQILPAVVHDVRRDDKQRRIFSGYLQILWDEAAVGAGLPVEDFSIQYFRLRRNGKFESTSKSFSIKLQMGSAYGSRRSLYGPNSQLVAAATVKTEKGTYLVPLSAASPELMSRFCAQMDIHPSFRIPLAEGARFHEYRMALSEMFLKAPEGIILDAWRLYLAGDLDESQLTSAVKSLRTRNSENEIYLTLSQIAAMSDRKKRQEALAQLPSTMQKSQLDSLDEAPSVALDQTSADASFRILKRNIGSGKHSVVDLVEDIASGQLFAWKQAVTDAAHHQESFEEEVSRSAVWREVGVSNVEVHWAEDGKSLLKTFVKGPTLREAIHANADFLSQPEHDMHKALRRFLDKLFASKHYIGDINGKNIIFDGQDWQIIDSGGISEKKSADDAKKEYVDKLPKKWVKQIPSSAVFKLEHFFSAYRSYRPSSYRSDRKERSWWRSCSDIFFD